MTRHVATRMDSLPRGMPSGNGNNWPAQQSPFGNPQMPGPPSWSNMPGEQDSSTCDTITRLTFHRFWSGKQP